MLSLSLPWGKRRVLSALSLMKRVFPGAQELAPILLEYAENPQESRG